MAGIVIKRRGESECYGFNTGSYFWSGYRYDKYKVGQGCFDVKITVRSGSYRKSEHFTLTNKGTTVDSCDFDLQPI